MTVKLLIVEDHQDLVKSLEKGLKLEGYSVDVAHDGLEGEYYIRNWDYDGIVLDLMLPGKNGLELLGIVREKGNTPVLILTAKDGVEDRVKGLDLGADDYLVKPFSYQELKARLRAIVRRSGGNASSVVTHGDLEMNCSNKRVSLAGQPVTLTAREYSVLEIFMQRKGEVVSRSYLYDRLGDSDEDTFSNTVDVMICKLRRKIGKGVIETRRGHGYIIGAS